MPLLEPSDQDSVNHADKYTVQKFAGGEETETPNACALSPALAIIEGKRKDRYPRESCISLVSKYQGAKRVRRARQ